MITVKQGNELREFKSFKEVCEAFNLNYPSLREKRSRDGLPNKMIVKSDLEIIFKAEE